jgi:hypothetical protein
MTIGRERGVRRERLHPRNERTTQHLAASRLPIRDRSMKCAVRRRGYGLRGGDRPPPNHTSETRIMKLSSTILGAFAALALATVPACDDKKDGDKKTEEKKTETKDGKTKTETKTTEVKTEPAKEETKTAEGGGGGDKIGIPECDEYIEKYTKCIQDKMPEASRQQMKDAMDQSVKAWKEAAAGPAKDGLATSCKAALDAAKQATSSMGCEW